MTTTPMAESSCDATLLPRLVPTAVAPAPPPPSSSSGGLETYDTAAAALLRRVLALEVAPATDDHGRPVYAVSVVLQSEQSRLPLPRATLAPAKALAPSVVAVHGFAAFRTLRDAVYDAAQRGHAPDEGVAFDCAFCARVVAAVVLDEAQPHRYDPWLRAPARVASRLRVFVDDLVARARGDPDGADATAAPTRRSARPRCAVQARVQTLVAAFLQQTQAA